MERGSISSKIPNSIQGLSTIARNGDTSFTYNEDTLALAANIGMGASKAGYSASAEFQGTTNFVQIRTRYDNGVQLFWEGHKNLRNLPHVFDVYQVNVKTIRQITQIFVASWEMYAKIWIET